MEELNLIKDFGTPAGLVAMAIYLVGKDIVKAIKAKISDVDTEAHKVITRTDERGRYLVYGIPDEKIDRMIELLVSMSSTLVENGKLIKEHNDDI